MSDDIVARLRGSIPGNPDYFLELISNAADKIEQLQDLCHALYHAIHCSDDNHRIDAERRYQETFRDRP